MILCAAARVAGRDQHVPPPHWPRALPTWRLSKWSSRSILMSSLALMMKPRTSPFLTYLVTVYVVVVHLSAMLRRSRSIFCSCFASLTICRRHASTSYQRSVSATTSRNAAGRTALVATFPAHLVDGLRVLVQVHGKHGAQREALGRAGAAAGTAHAGQLDARQRADLFPVAVLHGRVLERRDQRDGFLEAGDLVGHRQEHARALVLLGQPLEALVQVLSLQECDAAQS